jgi:O-antigen ligase
MVLLVFCRPSRRWSLVILGMAAGCGTIVLTGSRGVFAALLALLVVLALSLRWRTGAARLSVLAGMLAIGATLPSVPELRHQVRLSELHSDVQRMELGDSDSSAGARVERLQVAWQTFLDHPLVGLASVISTARCSACRSAGRTRKSCAATWGMPTTTWPNGRRPRCTGPAAVAGGVWHPLWLFVRLHRRSGRATFRGRPLPASCW